MNFKKFLVLLIAMMSLNSYAQTTLWSMTKGGGSSGAGSIFKLSEDGSALSTEYNFPASGFVGASPETNNQCQASNGKIYGTMTGGGLYGYGVIYSFDIATSSYTALYHFTGKLDGSSPTGSLIQATDGLLYGMTPVGGTNFSGVIFSFNIATGTYTKLFDFSNTNGVNPYGGFIQASNGLLYGMTFNGGNNNVGIIFSYNTSTSTFTKLFNLASATGASPFGNLKQSLNGKLYGMTAFGGTNNLGTIFSFDITTNTFTKRFDFSSANGSTPKGGLVETSSGLFYGLTSKGGTTFDGVLFSFNDATLSYTKLHDFNNSLVTDGGSPFNDLTIGTDGNLYGTTTQDGINGTLNVGTIFSYAINTSTFTKVFTFTVTTTGRNPQTALLQATNGKFYGLCKDSGAGGFGTAFSFDPTTLTFTKITDLFLLSNGGLPYNAMTKASNGLFYGLTKSGGANSDGVLFSFDPSTSTYTKLIDLPANANPEGTVVQASNGKLYGMTLGAGTTGLGSIFSYDIATNIYTTVSSLVNATGSHPKGNLIQGIDGDLYGMTTSGGVSSSGVIFKFVIATSTYTKLADFTNGIAGTGAFPYGSLLQATNGLMYGMTVSGGSSGDGTLFAFNPTSNAITKLFDFNGTNGFTPSGNLIQASNGKLYGLTNTTMFSFDISLNTLTTVNSFGLTTTAGKFPHGSLFQSANGKLYGVTTDGGLYGLGTAFNYDIGTSTFTKIHDFNVPEAASPFYASFLETNTTLTIGTIPPAPCLGSTISIPFNVAGLFNTGNIFTAQLSDAAGNFGSPITIGTLAGQGSGTISATLPMVTAGTDYKIRILSSNPAYTSTHSSIFTIRSTNKVLFTESMGTSSGNIAISTHEAANGFDNDAFTMSGSTTVRNSTASSGYPEASGNANVFFNTSVSDFLISGINTTGQTGIELSFGIHKNGTTTISDLIVVDYSTDGTNFFPLSYTLPTGAGTNIWFYRTATGNIPAAANLRLRFRQTVISPTNQYRIDDIRLTADDTNAGIAFSGSNYICTGTSTTLIATPEVSYLWSNGSTTQSISVNTAGTYTCVLTALNGCTLTSNSLAVNDSTPIQYSMTGGGSYCSSPGTGVVIGLSSSQLNYSYQLYRNTTTTVGSPIIGTGSALSFGLNTAVGTYTVVATKITGCTQTMAGSAIVSITTATTYYIDGDGDGYGNPASTTLACAPTSGIVSNNSDCDDSNASVNPLATEICNGVDDNCNGYIDEGCGTPKYCIGPSASYTAPSGPSYVNQFSPFPTLTAAVAYLNAFSPTQDVIFEFQNNYAGAGETFPINITYQGNATATAVFRPRSDVAFTLVIAASGSGSTSGLIQLNGADYVSFDGSPGGTLGTTSKLMVRNTLTSGSANANFYFLNDATHNTVNAVTIEGGASSYHCIYFGTTSGSSGNDFNTIQNCFISNQMDVSATLPEIAIHSSSLATGSAANSDMIITGNKIVNISDGVFVDLNGSAGSWAISNNHFYFTDNTATFKISEAIHVESIGNLFTTISSNYIGGTAPFAGGSPLIETNASIGTTGIYVRILNALSKSTISGNVIKNMQRISTGNGSFSGIAVESAPVDILNNTIGDPLVADDLSFSINANILFQGIRYTTAQNLFTCSFSGNSINNVTCLNTTGISGNFIGYAFTNTTTTIGAETLNNNSIYNIKHGGQGAMVCLNVDPSENATTPVIISNNKFEKIIKSNTTAGTYMGINCGRANVEITGNRIGSYTNANDIAIASPGVHYGIKVAFILSGNSKISNDTISNITISNGTSATKFFGIFNNSKGATTNEVSGNRINNLSCAGTFSATESSPVADYTLTGIAYFCDAANGLSVSNNSITELNATANTTADNPALSAINIFRSANAGSITISGNVIHSLINSGGNPTTLPFIAGIKLFNAQSNSSTVTNNMIAIKNDTSTNGVRVYGIYDGLNNNSIAIRKNYYFNSISISGITSGDSRSAAYWQNATSAKLNFQNNILHNARTGGTGSHFAIVHETGNANSWSNTTSNFNDLYTINGVTVGAYPLATSLSFSGWKSTSGGDVNSKNVSVNFINNATDLHLNTSNNCELESTGTPVAGITIDFDSQSRNATTPDIGADEFTGVCFSIVNLKAFIEGFYIGGGLMKSTINPALPTTDCDTVILELAQATAPFNILFSDTAILQTNGTAQFQFPYVVSGNSYYLVLKHRNALRVWGANPITLSSTINFDFSVAASQAFGSNQKLLSFGIHGLYSGDVNQNGTIDDNDLTAIENATQNYLTGYYSSDLTGDHQVESADYSLIENNSQLLLNVAHP